MNRPNTYAAGYRDATNVALQNFVVAVEASASVKELVANLKAWSREVESIRDEVVAA